MELPTKDAPAGDKESSEGSADEEDSSDEDSEEGDEGGEEHGEGDEGGEERGEGDEGGEDEEGGEGDGATPIKKLRYTLQVSTYCSLKISLASFPGSPLAQIKNQKEREEPGEVLSREKRHR